MSSVGSAPGARRTASFPAAASATPQRRDLLNLSSWGLALIFLSYVVYLPAGPALIHNQLVSGRNSLDDNLEKLWSAARYALAFGVAPLLLLTRSGGRAFVRCWPALPFAIFAASSIAWSVVPKESFREVLALFSVLVLTSTLVSWYGAVGFGRRAQIVTGSLAIASVAVAVLLPALGVHHATDAVAGVHAGRWRGVFLHKNLLGEFAVMAIVYALRPIRSEPPPWKLFFIVARICAFACWVMAGSAGAMGGGLIALAFFILMKNRITANPFITLAMILIGAALVPLLAQSAGEITSAFGRDATFSGRTEIWALGRAMIRDRLFFGSGPGADGAVFGELAKRSLFSDAVDLHSGYLDVIFNVGVVGAVLLVLAVCAALLRGHAYLQTQSGATRDQAAIFMTLIVAACAMAAVETAPVAMTGIGAIGLWTGVPALFQLRPKVRRGSPAT